MSDPIVTKVVDGDGVERWGSVDAAWVTKNQDPPADVPAPSNTEQKADDAAEVPADGDAAKPTPRKR